jgi:hypothetical protein
VQPGASLQPAQRHQGGQHEGDLEAEPAGLASSSEEGREGLVRRRMGLGQEQRVPLVEFQVPLKEGGRVASSMEKALGVQAAL